jgi:hypothetical protein
MSLAQFRKITKGNYEVPPQGSKETPPQEEYPEEE